MTLPLRPLKPPQDAAPLKTGRRSPSSRGGLLAACVAFAALLSGCASLPPAAMPQTEAATELPTAASPAANATPPENPSVRVDEARTEAQDAARAEPSTGPSAGTIADASANTTADAQQARITTGALLFERLAQGFESPACVDGQNNTAWRRRYAAHPEALERQLRDAMPLMAWVLEATERRGLPREFVLIPLIESGYRSSARGRGGPLGLWQMVASTARNHGVVVNARHDGRLSPVESTTGALDHLAELRSQFGDWRAAAMAYNAGESRLRRALAKSDSSEVSGERRQPAGMPNTTYTYIAKLRALACLIAEPTRYGLSLPSEAFTPFEPESVASPSTNTVSITGQREHTVRSGDTLWDIARQYGTTVAKLASANALRPNRPLRLGRVLRIPD